MLQIGHGAQIKAKATFKLVLYCITCTSPVFLVVFEVVRVIGLAASVEQACPQAICMYSFRLL